MNNQRLHLLFICSRNQWRSPTAEQIWRNDARFAVRSAGTSTQAKRHVAANDIRWADHIFAMESKHRARLQAEFDQLLRHKQVHVLNIPDDYRYMDPELIELLNDGVSRCLGL